MFGLCSLKSSPGVTTTALTLAGAWPSDGPGPTVVELDARGGDVAWRFGLASNPGLRSLAAASRLLPEPALLRAHAQLVGAAGVPVVVAPVERAAARQAVQSLAGLMNVLRDVAEPVLLDLGEIDLKDPAASDLLRGLSLLVVVTRALPEQIARVQAAAAELFRSCWRVEVLLIGDVGQAEAARLLPMPVTGVLPLINTDAGRLPRLVDHRSRKAFEAGVTRIAAALAGDVEPALIRSRAQVYSEDPR